MSVSVSGWDHQVAAAGPPANCKYKIDRIGRFVFDHGPHRWTYIMTPSALILVRYTRFTTGNRSIAVTLRYHG